MAKSVYYYSLKRLSSNDKYSVEKDVLTQIYHENKGRYGYRRITIELRNRGYRLNHKTVLRLMNLCDIKCLVMPRKYRSYKGDIGEAAPNLLERNFNADKPNEKWATDVTEFSLFGTKLYLSPIIDLYNREIVSYNISEKANFLQVMDMLDNAFKRIPDNTSLILHSDQGWQYRMRRYQRRLQQKGIRQSMSRKGNCQDNAVVENFFGLLKTELLYLSKFESMEHFQRELEEYMDYYNNNRIKSGLKGLSPGEYRNQSKANIKY